MRPNGVDHFMRHTRAVHLSQVVAFGGSFSYALADCSSSGSSSSRSLQHTFGSLCQGSSVELDCSGDTQLGMMHHRLHLAPTQTHQRPESSFRFRIVNSLPCTLPVAPVASGRELLRLFCCPSGCDITLDGGLSVFKDLPQMKNTLAINVTSNLKNI